MTDRLTALRQFYASLDRLALRTGGMRTLAACNGRFPWPHRGVYFFFENREARTDSGIGPRVVRVGTHALKETSQTTLWKRLAQHAGQRTSGGGNHRGSIFRLLLGEALKRREGNDQPATWGLGADPGAAALKQSLSAQEIKASELPLERAVSQYICSMPFLVVGVDDEAGPDSLRGLVERNAIALLSNYHRAPLDPPSEKWLGRSSGRDRVRESGLWNNNHVDEAWHPDFFPAFASAIERTRLDV
jgi:hypothetical protein